MTTAKKLLALLLALVLCLGILAGCDKKPAETTPGETKPGSSTGEAKLNKDIYPIDFDGTIANTGKHGSIRFKDRLPNGGRQIELFALIREIVTHTGGQISSIQEP